MDRKHVVLISLLLALSLALVGCGSSITVEEIVAKMEETIDSTHDAHAVVQANVDVQGIKMDVKAEIWEKMPNLFRAEVLETSDAQFAGTVMVSDGQQVWLYEPARNQVTVGRAGEVDMPLPQEMLGSLQEAIQEVLDASNVELVGEESVADHDAYKLRLSPREEAQEQVFPGNGTATVWVDKKRWIVLKATY
jgi:outer membrane lipoprotein-sorting protein